MGISEMLMVYLRRRDDGDLLEIVHRHLEVLGIYSDANESTG